MTRLTVLERGEELSVTTWQALASQRLPVRLKLREPAFPFLAADVVHVAPLGASSAHPRDLLLFRSGGGFRFGPGQDSAAPEANEPLGRVVAVERRAATISLEKALLPRVPLRWLSRTLDGLELVERLRHPCTPPLFLGNTGTCLAGVREKYNQPVESWEYSKLVRGSLEPLEREILVRHIKPGSRVLDIGCGGGREAIGLAREGYQVVGIDIAPRMVEAARTNAQREGLAITFRVQSATDLNEPAGSFDGAYWAGSYQHIPSRSLRLQTLRRIGKALTKDGALILMVAYGGRRGLISRSRLVDSLRQLLRRIRPTRPLSEPGDTYMRAVSEASDPQAPCFIHDFFGPGEVRGELTAAGFRSEEAEENWWVCWRQGDLPPA